MEEKFRANCDEGTGKQDRLAFESHNRSERPIGAKHTAAPQANPLHTFPDHALAIRGFTGNSHEQNGLAT